MPSLLSSSINILPTSISAGSTSWRAIKIGIDEGGLGYDALYIIDRSAIERGVFTSGTTPNR